MQQQLNSAPNLSPQASVALSAKPRFFQLQCRTYFVLLLSKSTILSSLLFTLFCRCTFLLVCSSKLQTNSVSPITRNSRTSLGVSTERFKRKLSVHMKRRTHIEFIDLNLYVVSYGLKRYFFQVFLRWFSIFR